MARANGYATRFPGVEVWPGEQWEYSLYLKETNQEVADYTQLDERSSWFYEAVGATVGMMGRTVGAGQVYLESSKDADGNWLEGSMSYTLHVPKDAPVAQFWSFTVYDNETRCFVDTGSYPDRSSRDDIVKNADGSVDLYFGPTPPPASPNKTGSRRSRTRAGSPISGSTARPKPILTRPGCCPTSSFVRRHCLKSIPPCRTMASHPMAC